MGFNSGFKGLKKGRAIPILPPVPSWQVINFTFAQRLLEYEIRRFLYMVVSGCSIQGKYERQRNKYC